jgi:fumarate reductase flavoprotein subunit
MIQLAADVLVIGAGTAGLSAAVAAAKIGARVIVVHKGDNSVSTLHADMTFEIMGGGGCGLAAPLVEPDNNETYFDDLMRVAAGRSIPELTGLFAERSTGVVRNLRDRGVRFCTQPGGQFTVAKEIWHSHARLVYSEHGTGREIIDLLRGKAVSLGVQILKVTVFRLLTTDGTVSGCLGMADNTYEVIHFTCGSVIIATGGRGRIIPAYD